MHEPSTNTTARRSSSRATPRACRRPASPSWSSSQTATSSSSRSSRSRSGSATRPCGCWPTTARSPGPTLEGAGGLEIVVNVENHGDLEATVHWHGLRLENRYDGTHETQAPIQVGERSHVRVTFPDPGAYWYHPHIREDYGQEMGLYGNFLVVPRDPDYWPPAQPRPSADARRHLCSRTARSPRSAARRRPTWRWGASATCCSSTARPTSR